MVMDNRKEVFCSILSREIIFPRIQDDILDNLKTHSQQLPAVRKFLITRIKKMMSYSNPQPPSTLDACLSRTMCYILSFTNGMLPLPYLLIVMLILV